MLSIVAPHSQSNGLRVVAAAKECVAKPDVCSCLGYAADGALEIRKRMLYVMSYPGDSEVEVQWRAQ